MVFGRLCKLEGAWPFGYLTQDGQIGVLSWQRFVLNESFSVLLGVCAGSCGVVLTEKERKTAIRRFL